MIGGTLLALVLVGGLIAFARGWRLPLLALAVQYVLVGALLSQVVSRDVALVKVVVGGVVGAVLLITKRRTSPWPQIALVRTLPPVSLPWQRSDQAARSSASRKGQVPGGTWSVRPLLRYLAGSALPLLLMLCLALTSITLLGLWQQRSPIPMPGATGLAAVWMMGIGLLTLSTRRRPFSIGLGLLTLITGFEMAYAPLEPSLIMAGLLGFLNIAVGLAIASIEAAALPLEGRV